MRYRLLLKSRTRLLCLIQQSSRETRRRSAKAFGRVGQRDSAAMRLLLLTDRLTQPQVQEVADSVAMCIDIFCVSDFRRAILYEYNE